MKIRKSTRVWSVGILLLGGIVAVSVFAYLSVSSQVETSKYKIDAYEAYTTVPMNISKFIDIKNKTLSYRFKGSLENVVEEENGNVGLLINVADASAGESYLKKVDIPLGVKPRGNGEDSLTGPESLYVGEGYGSLEIEVYYNKTTAGEFVFDHWTVLNPIFQLIQD